MKCPRCVQPVAAGEDSCRNCGYSLEVPDAQFGQGAVAVERLTDADGNLSAAERVEIRGILEEFERRFPQLFLMVYLGSLPPPASPRQFAFWLLNHAAVAELDALRPNERGLVLVVDPLAGAAALSAGYFLECYLRQEELDQCLAKARAPLVKGRWVEAVRELMRALTQTLVRRGREADRDPAAFAAPLPGQLLRAFPGLVQLGEPLSGEPPSGGPQKSPQEPVGIENAETPAASAEGRGESLPTAGAEEELGKEAAKGTS